jgi:hypothetical protein
MDAVSKTPKSTLARARGSFRSSRDPFIVLPVTRFDIVFRAVNFCWLVLLVVVVLRLRHWRCPRCGKRFFAHSETRFKFSYEELWELPTAKILRLDVCKCSWLAFIRTWPSVFGTHPAYCYSPFMERNGGKNVVLKTLNAIALAMLFVSLLAQRLFHPR